MSKGFGCVEGRHPRIQRGDRQTFVVQIRKQVLSLSMSPVAFQCRILSLVVERIQGEVLCRRVGSLPFDCKVYGSLSGIHKGGHLWGVHLLVFCFKHQKAQGYDTHDAAMNSGTLSLSLDSIAVTAQIPIKVSIIIKSRWRCLMLHQR